MARRRVFITTPYPSMEEIAKTYRIPRREMEAVKAMVADILASPRYRALAKPRAQRRRSRGKPS